MKNFKSLLLLLVGLFLFSSCDKITKHEIKVSSMSIELDDIMIPSGTKSTANEELIFFSASQTLTLSILQGLSEEAIEYKDKIESIEVGSASIILYSTDEAGTVVKEFVLQAVEIDNINIDEYVLGEIYTDGVQRFADNLLLKLFTTDNVTINTSGKTDITSGENLKVKITLEDITFLANILK